MENCSQKEVVTKFRSLTGTITLECFRYYFSIYLLSNEHKCLITKVNVREKIV